MRRMMSSWIILLDWRERRSLGKSSEERGQEMIDTVSLIDRMDRTLHRIGSYVFK
jgi:hypothetical protein